MVGPYLEQQILSASPLQLISLSYQTAIQAVRDARRFLAENKIMDRARSISLAHGVLGELYRSLDFTAGDGAMARELARLYDFMMRRLLDANARQADEPLSETLQLLCTLAEAWSEIAVNADRAKSASRPRETSNWGLNVEPAASSYSLCG